MNCWGNFFIYHFLNVSSSVLSRLIESLINIPVPPHIVSHIALLPKLYLTLGGVHTQSREKRGNIDVGPTASTCRFRTSGSNLSLSF